MIGPTRGDVVVLVIPQREKVSARVDDSGAGFFSLWLLQEPRTPMPVLARTRVFLQFAGVDGVGRILGTVSRDGLHGLRFERLAPAQLLRRADALHARVSANITVFRADATDHVAIQAHATQVSGGSIVLRGIPGVAVGQLYQFDMHLLEREAPISGQFRVQGINSDGTITTRITMMAPRERSRLVHYANDHQRQVA